MYARNMLGRELDSLILATLKRHVIHGPGSVSLPFPAGPLLATVIDVMHPGSDRPAFLQMLSER